MRGGKAPPLIPPEKERLNGAPLFMACTPDGDRWRPLARAGRCGQLLRGAQDGLFEVLAGPGVLPDPGGEDGVGRGLAWKRALGLAVDLDLGPLPRDVGQH